MGPPIGSISVMVLVTVTGPEVGGSSGVVSTGFVVSMGFVSVVISGGFVSVEGSVAVTGGIQLGLAFILALAGPKCLK